MFSEVAGSCPGTSTGTGKAASPALALRWPLWQHSRAVGLPRVDFELPDLDRRVVSSREFVGKVMVLVCEDKDASEQNRAFKTRLTSLVRGRGDVQVLGIADVSAFDIAPARPFVRLALERVRTDDGVLLLVDWKGVVRKRYDLPGGKSSVIVTDQRGDVRRITSGPLAADAREELCDLVVALADQSA